MHWGCDVGRLGGSRQHPTHLHVTMVLIEAEACVLWIELQVNRAESHRESKLCCCRCKLDLLAHAPTMVCVVPVMGVCDVTATLCGLMAPVRWLQIPRTVDTPWPSRMPTTSPTSSIDAAKDGLMNRRAMDSAVGPQFRDEDWAR